ncbi:chemotaxis protein CheW [Methanosphaerula palustris]|uniref:CheW protein n=1 Tax=Methanosphaerula palustris (strain ATCC BAA-1556 / DSM 19958 / E1-9c) TaxID=521011 RepID=B8GF96_METPE|nr:chemotaxis protein CheW [Methanosphaerula palustris]ACL17902.1 CheW protein [Methanosphaerula palustris E1-9c]
MTESIREEHPEAGIVGGAREERLQQGSIAENVQVVEFLLGKEHFAIDLFDVREVVEYTTITKLPNTPSYIRGIIDLRGEITTIIDLKEQMNIRADIEVKDDDSRIIVLDDRITRSKIGIMVDDVSSVSTFSLAQVDKTAIAETSADAHIIGIIKKKTKIKEKDITELIIWIDIRHLLGTINHTA